MIGTHENTFSLRSEAGRCWIARSFWSHCFQNFGRLGKTFQDAVHDAVVELFPSEEAKAVGTYRFRARSRRFALAYEPSEWFAAWTLFSLIAVECTLRAVLFARWTLELAVVIGADIFGQRENIVLRSGNRGHFLNDEVQEIRALYIH